MSRGQSNTGGLPGQRVLDYANAVVVANVEHSREVIENDLEGLQVRLINLISNSKPGSEKVHTMERSLKFLSEVQTCFQGLLKARPRPDLLWLACLEVDRQVKRLGSSVGRSLVVLHGLRLVAEREDRARRRNAAVFSLEFFTSRHPLSPVGGS